MLQERLRGRAARLMLAAAVLTPNIIMAGLQNGAFKARLNNVEISYIIAGDDPVIMMQGMG
jgi:hypothetical protein